MGKISKNVYVKCKLNRLIEDQKRKRKEKVWLKVKEKIRLKKGTEKS